MHIILDSRICFHIYIYYEGWGLTAQGLNFKAYGGGLRFCVRLTKKGCRFPVYSTKNEDKGQCWAT